MKISEFFVEIGFDADSKTLGQFTKELKDMPARAAEGIAVLAGLDFAMGRVASKAMETALGFDIFSAQTGESWRELQRWQIGAERLGVSADAVTGSIQSLQHQMIAIRLGQGNAAPFNMLGIVPSASGSVFDLLKLIRERVRGYDRKTGSYIIQQMGLAPEMMRIFQESDAEFEKLTRTVAGLDDRQEKLFLSMRSGLTALKMGVQQDGIDIITDFTDALGGFDAVMKGIRDNVPLWVGAIAAVGVAVAPVTTAIAGLVLLMDDVAAWSTGKKSIMGPFLDDFKAVVDNFKGNRPLEGLEKLAELSMGALLPGTSAIYGKTVAQTNYLSIHGQNAATIAEETKHQLKRMFSAAEQQLDNGGH